MEKLNIDALFDSAATEMHSAFKRSLAGMRPDEIGAPREEQVRQFLKDWLPEKYGISKGYLVSEKKVSKECDVVIFDKEQCPKIYLSQKNDIRIFPINYVYCTIEVKSILNNKELENSLLKIQSVNEVYQNYRFVKKNRFYTKELDLFLAENEELRLESHLHQTSNKRVSEQDYFGYKGKIIIPKKYSTKPIRVIWSYELDNKLELEYIKNRSARLEFQPDIYFCLKLGNVIKLNADTLSRVYSMQSNISRNEFEGYSEFALLDYIQQNPRPGFYFDVIKEGKDHKNLMLFYAVLMDLLNDQKISKDFVSSDIIAAWKTEE